MSSENEKTRKAIFAKLRGIRRKLNAQGVPCIQARNVLSHEDAEHGFKITYRPTGDNGDTTLMPQLSIRAGQSIEEFDGANFEFGLSRVKELFQAQDGPTQDDTQPQMAAVDSGS